MSDFDKQLREVNRILKADPDPLRNAARTLGEEPDPRERFVLYRLCDCLTCEGKGKARQDSVVEGLRSWMRCPECRGEGRVRQELATCETPEAVGVAIVTLAREGEFEECPIGLLDRTPECPKCGGHGRLYGQRPVRSAKADIGCPECKGTGVKPTGTWLILPWLPSPRNASDAGKLLRSRRK